MDNVTSICRYNTAKNLSIQHRSGFMDGLLCASYGLHNDNGKTSLDLNGAYMDGFAEGRKQHAYDVWQAAGNRIELSLVA